ncbi:MAG: hypothetical protein AAGI11_06410 [Pseudomonadota bacterium]
MSELRKRRAVAVSGTTYLQPRRGIVKHQVSASLVSGSGQLTIRIQTHIEGGYEDVVDGTINLSDPQAKIFEGDCLSIEIEPSSPSAVFNVTCT